MTERTSRFDFAGTLAAAERSIEAKGMTIFARIDHAAAARSAGLSMPPTIVLLYGNATKGTPVMRAAPAVALELPLRLLVREADGMVIIGFHDVGALLEVSGVPAAAAAALAKAQDHVISEVALLENETAPIG